MENDSPKTQTKRLLAWNRSSYALLSLFIAAILLILYVWWPLAQEYLSLINPDYPIWLQIDWLLVGIFLFMTFMIMAGADLRYDLKILLVGLAGGLVIESWGTQTLLWTYYTAERPPLWIIPAWPIASLAIDRMVRLLDHALPQSQRAFKFLYALVFPVFLALMLAFVWPTLDKSLTWMALAACLLIALTPTNHRLAVLTFLAGSALGYFLERWGTTRECWTYYTLQTPPLFAVLAHGLAAVAFWRARLIAEWFIISVHTGKFLPILHSKPERGPSE
jgi:hypothetical protein